ncbi:transcription termination factor NusA [Xylocopilactobacillus apis]|uniref:Transcription termination/antitermination protein NusA n=1 Tax=Xylocopilactobacillus apis TaxID=2932183 RepID=A0AAU9D646_9LACO|nr:transcription termination factor NusA [Xylocopilactobacillus apis]BDR56252.1 transcription termination/antitermination protein NusA [Xylocopilactobacillus apis]
MSQEVLQALKLLEEDKGVKKEVIIDALVQALRAAYKKHYGQNQNVDVEFDEQTGEVHVYQIKEVVDQVFDNQLEVSIEDAQNINKGYEVGDKVNFEVTPKNFGRLAAQSAKQVIFQKIREEERSAVFQEYADYQHEVMQGFVQRVDNKFVYVNLGKIEGVIGKSDQIPNESYEANKRLKVYVTNVENTTKGPRILLSRTSPELVKRLFEQEVPEIYNGTIEIVSIAREPGDRSKIAVRSNDENVPAVGTTVGQRGQRVQNIVDELNGENMDIIEWEKDPIDFIANALKPADVIAVQFSEEDEKNCLVIVPDDQLSLAIGKRGQNARLAAKLTNYKIDIKPESEVEFTDDDNSDSEE